MKGVAWVGAALALALTAGCKDRDHGDADDQARATADRAGNAVDSAADAVGDAANDAANGVEGSSYERRDEFRREVDERIAALDKELADLRAHVNKDATESYRKAVAAASETRRTLRADVDRLSGATAANWDELKTRVSVTLDSLDRQVKALRPDAKPMGGAGPS
jgi:DNA anti-recombination protein RmuC